MSFSLTALAWRQKLPPMPKLVLLVLADLAGDDGLCFPNTKTICDRVGTLPLAVFKAVKRLEAEQLLAVERRRGHPNIYRLQLKEPT